MSSFYVEVAPRARRELLRFAGWWQEHSGRPGLVSDEVAEAIEMLATFPEIGRGYPRAKRGEVRRWPLPRTQLYLYYRVLPDARTVQDLSFWHTARGRGPRL